MLFLFSAVETDVAVSICPVLFAAYLTGGFPKQILVFPRHLRVRNISSWEAYGLVVAERCACRASVHAFSGVGNYCFPILKCENAVWAEFNAAWFSSLSAAVALIRKNYGKPRTCYVIQDVHLLTFRIHQRFTI